MRKDVQDLLSIIVPIYNTSKYLDRCIESIVNQTVKNIQIILVNDGSTDNSLEYCENWREKDERILIVNKENGGLVSARLAGLQASTGDLVGFVDSDDYIEPPMYERLIQAKMDTEADFVYCGLHNCYESEKGIKYSSDNEPKVVGRFELENKGINFLKKHIFTTDLGSQAYTGGICLGVYDKAFIMEAYSNVPLDCSQGEDLICQIWMILHADRIVFLKDVLYHYCIRKGSITDLHINEKKTQIIRMIDTIKEICKKSNVLDAIKDDIDCFKKMLFLLENAKNRRNSICELYVFSKEAELEGKKVVIYAAGVVGKSYKKQLDKNERIEIVALVDKNANENGIEPFCKLKKMKFDILIIAVERKSLAKEIEEDLCAEGIDKGKILWIPPVMNLELIKKMEI